METPPSPQLVRLALHGGAGDPPTHPAAQSAQRDALRRIATETLALLRGGAGALDAVTHAVEQLEQCPLFNAGVGAVLNREGLPELDAAVMRGVDRACGAVAAVCRVKSPVRLARAIMERTPHVFFAGAGAEQLAAQLGLERVEPDYFITEARRQQLAAARARGAITLDHDHAPSPGAGGTDEAFGTVGAVARDAQGHLAAATSTGGLTNKLAGRVGDTPLIGAGTFADDASAALSCTGTGEAFIRCGFGHAVHARLAWSGWHLEHACAEALDAVRRYRGRGGCIAVDRAGRLALPFNAGGMYRAWVEADGLVRVAIGPGGDGA
ncbi:MAG: isoaspartyl peptidase/L-asparaginase [Nevskia sp.]|nr:isoaspartyl peptidase/L-asparaginase [Nevskia sp.]